MQVLDTVDIVARPVFFHLIHCTETIFHNEEWLLIAVIEFMVCTPLSVLTFTEEQRDLIRSSLPPWAKLVWFQGFFPGEVVMGGEISEFSVSKATAMQEICRHYYSTAENCIAFGDSMNDAEIIRAAGVGIAMGSADDGMKEIADMVCPSCEENGIASVLGLLTAQ